MAQPFDYGSIKLDVVDNSTLVQEEFNKAVARTLTRWGKKARDTAVVKARFDTGLLRNSIAFALDGEAPDISSYHAERSSGAGDNQSTRIGFYSGTAPKEPDGSRAVYVGSNSEYAIYNEMGTGKHAEGGGGRPTPWVYQGADGNFYRTEGMTPKPFIRPAFEENTAEFERIAKEEFGG